MTDNGDDSDPYLESMMSTKKEEVKKDLPLNNITTTIPFQQIVPHSNKAEKDLSEKFDYDYQIVLTPQNEDWLMENFLTDAINDDKQHSDTSDWYNFGLDEDKWRKLLNHSILMHYEKHLMEQAEKQEQMINNSNNNTNPQQQIPKNNQMLPLNNNNNFMMMNRMMQMMMQRGNIYNGMMFPMYNTQRKEEEKN